jgi:hypothetical protein
MTKSSRVKRKGIGVERKDAGGVGVAEFHFIVEGEWHEVDKLFSKRAESELNPRGELIGQMSL